MQMSMTRIAKTTYKPTAPRGIMVCEFNLAIDWLGKYMHISVISFSKEQASFCLYLGD